MTILTLNLTNWWRGGYHVAFGSEIFNLVF